MRNATVTTIAPTGSISMICDTSSGIEPLFGIGYIKNVLDDTKFRYVNAFFERAVQDMDISSDDKEELLDYVCSTGSLVGFNAKDGWSGDAIPVRHHERTVHYSTSGYARGTCTHASSVPEARAQCGVKDMQHV